jgi:hypothetical protein
VGGAPPCQNWKNRIHKSYCNVKARLSTFFKVKAPHLWSFRLLSCKKTINHSAITFLARMSAIHLLQFGRVCMSNDQGYYKEWPRDGFAMKALGKCCCRIVFYSFVVCKSRLISLTLVCCPKKAVTKGNPILRVMIIPPAWRAQQP